MLCKEFVHVFLYWLGTGVGLVDWWKVFYVVGLGFLIGETSEQFVYRKGRAFHGAKAYW